MRLPKPLYEFMPAFLIGVGVFFIALVLNRYEHAPMLLTWFTGLFCIAAGIAMAAVRFVRRRNHPHRD